MTDYTPTTDQVRSAYTRAMRNAFIASAGEHDAEFDRWLAGVIRQAKREAWNEGYLTCLVYSAQPKGTPKPECPYPLTHE